MADQPRSDAEPQLGRLLVCGATGQIGTEIVAAAARFGFDAVGTDRNELDVTDAAAAHSVVRQHAPDVVINAAAYTAVDRAEEDQRRAFAVNRDGVRNLASAASACSIPLLHLSTDYVFDGCSAGAYAEDARPNPLGVYGQSKWEGEDVLRAGHAKHVIVRVSWVFGLQGHNFVRTMLRVGRERTDLRVVDDQYGCPTPARDAARVLLRIARAAVDGSAQWGTYHYCGTPATTWFGFAQAVFAEAAARGYGTLPALTPIATEAFPTPARRPMNSVLACERIQSVYGIEPLPWRPALQEMLCEIAAEQQWPVPTDGGA